MLLLAAQKINLCLAACFIFKVYLSYHLLSFQTSILNFLIAFRAFTVELHFHFYSLCRFRFGSFLFLAVELVFGALWPTT